MKYEHKDSLMYAEYPHKKYWSKTFSHEDYESAFRKMIKNDRSLMLYVHIPFCPKLCYYCSCHTIITQDYNMIKEYLCYLYKEIDLIESLCDSLGLFLNVTDVHIGGGSPTILDKNDFYSLCKNLRKLVDFDNVKEFSIEIDPRDSTKHKLGFYRDIGINRISIGVQDFDPDVQRAINRIQPIEIVENIMSDDTREWFPKGINFDIICGLPHQTVETIKNTFNEVVRLSPSRICFNYLHYTPVHKKHQNIMFDGKHGRPNKLPDFKEKKLLFKTASDILTKNGYMKIGYEHFANCNDELYLANIDKKVKWNALGVTSREYSDILGVGVHSYSTLGKYYMQNYLELKHYKKALDKGTYPVYRGHCLSNDDVIRKDIIKELRNFFAFKISSIENKHSIIFNQYFKNEIIKLQEFIDDDMVIFSKDTVQITEKGQLFANIVCKCFDKYTDVEV